MNIQKIKKVSAVIAVVFGVVFTFCGLLSIWGIAPFAPLGDESGVTNRVIPTLALLTAAFFVLTLILRAVEEKD